VAFGWFLFFSYHNAARSNKHQTQININHALVTKKNIQSGIQFVWTVREATLHIVGKTKIFLEAHKVDIRRKTAVYIYIYMCVCVCVCLCLCVCVCVCVPKRAHHQVHWLDNILIYNRYFMNSYNFNSIIFSSCKVARVSELSSIDSLKICRTPLCGGN